LGTLYIVLYATCSNGCSCLTLSLNRSIFWNAVKY